MKQFKFIIGFLSIVMLMLSACSKFDAGDRPIYNINLAIVKNSLDSTASTNATISVTMIDKGLPTVTSQGVCWATYPNPVHDSSSTISVSDTLGSYNVTITGLTQKTTYYARAFAISSAGVSYGKLITFRTPAASSYFMGEFMAGGLVCYIDTTGQHGLVCDTTDLGGDSIVWNNLNDTLISTGTSIGTGYTNTQNLIAYYGNDGISAPALCVNYRGGGFSDWFLPSKDELNQIYLNLYSRGFGNLSPTGIYWSSSEYIYNGAYYAWSQYFNNGYQYYFSQGLYLKVRAVRAF